MAGHILMTIVVLLTAAPRCLALVEIEAKILKSELWGFATDFVVGIWVGLLFLVLHRWKPWVAAVAAGGWAVLGILAAEHLRALGAWPDIRHAEMLGSSTFVMGSLLQPAYLGWMLLAAILGSIAVILVRNIRYVEAGRRALLTALVGTLILLVFPPDPADGWRGKHFIPENLGRLWQDRVGEDGLAAAQDISIGESHRRRVDAWFRRDLEGERLTTVPERLPNVLLVVVESLGSERIGSIHGLPYDPREAPHLSTLAEQHLFVPCFINQQRQTNRGTYALMSGTLPLLQKSSPRMSIFSSLPDRPYLPAVLAQHGYRTAYLQSADLSFMGKKPFLHAAGFAEVSSAMDVRPARAASSWGVDDVTLMDEALRWVDEAEQEKVKHNAVESPWFLTVLTVGTHHPHTIPDDFKALPGESENGRAFRYADVAIGRLMAGLDERDAWDNTLLLITSDETGVSSKPDLIRPEISETWGVFIAAVPGENSYGAIEGLYGQSDVALSVLDYLGLGESGPTFYGRSIFRRYTTPRELPFANVYRRQMGIFLADGGVELYGEHFNPIAKFQTSDQGKGMGLARLKRDDDARDHDFLGFPVLADLVIRQREAIQENKPMVFLPPGRYAVVPPADYQRGAALTRAQFFYSPRESSVTVEVALRAEDIEAIEKIELHCLDIKAQLTLEEDGYYRARRTIIVERAQSSFQIRLRVYTKNQQPIDIEVDKAEFTIRPIQ